MSASYADFTRGAGSGCMKAVRIQLPPIQVSFMILMLLVAVPIVHTISSEALSFALRSTG